MANKKQSNTIAIPREVLQEMAEAYRKMEDFSEKFEDFVISNDEFFLAKLKKARKSHQEGELENFEEIIS